MDDKFFTENLKKSVNYDSLGTSSLEEFGEIYKNTVMVNKLQSLIQNIEIKTEDEIKAEVKDEIKEESIFFKNLKANVNK